MSESKSYSEIPDVPEHFRQSKDRFMHLATQINQLSGEGRVTDETLHRKTEPVYVREGGTPERTTTIQLWCKFDTGHWAGYQVTEIGARLEQGEDHILQEKVTLLGEEYGEQEEITSRLLAIDVCLELYRRGLAA